ARGGFGQPLAQLGEKGHTAPLGPPVGRQPKASRRQGKGAGARMAKTSSRRRGKKRRERGHGRGRQPEASPCPFPPFATGPAAPAPPSARQGKGGEAIVTTAPCAILAAAQ